VALAALMPNTPGKSNPPFIACEVAFANVS